MKVLIVQSVVVVVFRMRLNAGLQGRHFIKVPL